MKITSAHIDALRVQVHDTFVTDMVLFFQKRDAFHSKALGPEGLRDAVVFGIAQARAHGITQRDPVRVYLQLMFFLGGRFSTDPLLGWTRSILSNQTQYVSQAARMEALRWEAIEYLRATCGSDGVPLRQFLTCCQSIPDAVLDSMTEAKIVTFLQAEYRLKAEYIGAAMLARLGAESARTCAKAGLNAPSSLFWYTGMRFVYGTGVSEDPLFPWVHKLFWQTEPEKDKDRAFQRLAASFMKNVQTHVSSREVQNVR